MIKISSLLLSFLLCLHLSTVLADANKPFLPPHDLITTKNASNTVSLAELKYGYDVTGAAFSPDGTTLATTGSELPILWDIQSGSMIFTLQVSIEGNYGQPSNVAFSTDGQLVLSTGFDSTYIEGSEGSRAILCIWERKSGNLLTTVEGYGGQYGHEIGKVVFSPNMQQFAISNPPSIWNIKDVRNKNQNKIGDELHNLVVDYERGAGVTYSPDGQTLITASEYGIVRYWEVSTGVQQKSVELQNTQLFNVVLSPDGTLLAISSSQIKARPIDFPPILDNHIIQIWSAETDKTIMELSGHQKEIFAISFSPDGKLLASASGDGSTRLWEVETGKQVALLQVNDQIIWDVAFSPDGTLIATASRDGIVRLWGVPSQ